MGVSWYVEYWYVGHHWPVLLFLIEGLNLLFFDCLDFVALQISLFNENFYISWHFKPY